MDLGFLDPLYRRGGPVASAYLDTTLAVEDAAKQIELRWRDLRAGLAEEGADEPTLKAMDDAAGGVAGIPGPQGEALFAAGGELLGAYSLSRPPVRDRATFSALPDVRELAADRENGMPYVVVATDRVGADVYAYAANGGEPTERSFNGATLHIQKVRGGGYAHKHYQRTSEELWSANAAAVAEDVTAAIEDVGAAAVFVGGDERAIGKLREHLGKHANGLLVEVAGGGRADESALASLRDSVDSALRQVAEARHEEVISQFDAEVQRQGRAVEGAGRTVEALRSGQVGTLLLADPGGQRSVLWTAPGDPVDSATDRGRLADPEQAVTAPVDAVLLRAAHATDAAFATLSEGDIARIATAPSVGAILRFTMEL
ncbi:hypothetical protein CLV63_103216 [Murinocardiopsis flavida]|uniref:Peptide subunit release factor 1 (ERF1) n=1 Tax=Murinocardiopsis flavida TaxID=645275 RepID=A0A2P8DQK3_9ACTN|nr:Vms1/Ankzf1 family peptidyl-tRNA hydrolase [Murinocardiopsis flavida]PSK99491.1 hypothetical protein CLV63_103216 [Murinocardiopsis flavida]